MVACLYSCPITIRPPVYPGRYTRYNPIWARSSWDRGNIWRKKLFLKSPVFKILSFKFKKNLFESLNNSSHFGLCVGDLLYTKFVQTLESRTCCQCDGELQSVFLYQKGQTFGSLIRWSLELILISYSLNFWVNVNARIELYINLLWVTSITNKQFQA